MNSLWKKYLTIVSISFVIISAIPTNISASQSNIKCQVIKSYGVDASFSFELQYSPSNLYARPGDEVEISYSPSPGDVTLKVDFYDLIYSILDSSYIDDEDSFLTLTIPVGQTPLGTYELGSYTIADFLIGDINAELSITGQINGTVSADDDSIDGTRLIWPSRRLRLICSVSRFM